MNVNFYVHLLMCMYVHMYAGLCTEWLEAAGGGTYWRHQLSKILGND